VRWLLLVLALAGCSNRASQAECERAADRMIEIFTAPRVSESGKVLPEAQQLSTEWAKNLKEKDTATRALLISACRSHMTDDHVACITSSALDEKSLAACFAE
jgi:hypothetical protein